MTALTCYRFLQPWLALIGHLAGVARASLTDHSYSATPAMVLPRLLEASASRVLIGLFSVLWSLPSVSLQTTLTCISAPISSSPKLLKTKLPASLLSSPQLLLRLRSIQQIQFTRKQSIPFLLCREQTLLLLAQALRWLHCQSKQLLETDV